MKKLTIELNMANYNEHRITNFIFNQTSHIFANIGAEQVKGMCTFQVVARKELEEDAPIIRDLYFTTSMEELHLITYNETTSKWSQQLAQDIDEWTENLSGFIVTKIVRAYCTFLTYRSRFGGYQKDLPDDFYKNGRILNIVNTPPEATDCLKICINIALNRYTEVDKTTFALRELKGVLVDYKGIDTNPDSADTFAVYESPLPIHNIPLLARDLKMKFNVFKLHHVSGKKYGISTLITYNI